LIEQLGIFLSDSINLYGSRFTVGAIVDLLEKNRLVGNPSILGHDMQRPIGWSYPLAVHIEPGLTRLLGVSQTIETDEEAKNLHRHLNQFIYQKAVTDHRDEIEQLKIIIAEHLKGNEKIHAYREAVTFVEPDLARRVFPYVFSKIDKDGLVPLNILSSVGPGVFRIKDLILFAHPFFRRSCSRLNTLNTAFLRYFQLMAEQNFSARIALDTDSVGLASTYHETEELEYWWGPKFSDDLLSIPAGVTHHENSEPARSIHGIKSSEFSWQPRDGQHIFEAEELLDVSALAVPSDNFNCRYVHAIVQEDTGHIEHLDGAIRGYSKQQMLDRLVKDIAHSGRHTRYSKLWRIDGAIPVSQWKRLLSDYFRDNHLIGEYLGASTRELEYFHAVIPPEPETKVSLEKYVPYSMQKGDGIRASLSYHPLENKPNTRSVVCLDTLTLNDKDFRVVDADIVELRKALLRLGASLSIQPNVRFLKYKDIYSNLPLIVHAEDSLPEDLNVTLDAIRMLVTAWKKKKVDRVICFAIGFPVEDKEVRVSILGHIADVDEWLSSPLSNPPLSLDAIRQWAETLAETFIKQYPEAHNRPPILNTLMPSGVFLIQRKIIDEMKYQVSYSEEREAFYYQFIPTDEQGELIAALNNSIISPAPAIFITQSKCSKCGSQYEDCRCSTLLDDNVTRHISKAEIAFLFWTDRPVWPWQPSDNGGKNDPTNR
jgi:hypothetical protein